MALLCLGLAYLIAFMHLTLGANPLFDNLAFMPIIETIYPNAGLFTEETPMWIVGQHLGISKEDIVDVVVGNNSCKDALTWINPQKLQCIVYLTTLPSTYPPKLTVPVVVITHSGGTSNSSIDFTFEQSCYIYNSVFECSTVSPLCKWCRFSASCKPSTFDCDDGCSPGSVYLSCPELIGIITLSVLAFAIIAGIIAFAVWRENAMREKLANDVLSEYVPPSSDNASSRRSAPITAGVSVRESSEEDDSFDEDDDLLPQRTLSDAFKRRQEAIERKHRMLQQSKSLTSFL